MSEFAEVVGNDAADWRFYVEGLLTPNQRAYGARLDKLEADLNTHGCYPSTGNEIEFTLEPTKPRGALPDNDEFYDELVAKMCGDEVPLTAHKGEVLDPLASAAPLILNRKRLGTHNWENGWEWALEKGIRIKQTLEARTYPSVKWRESERRRWTLTGTIGSLAAKYNCRAKIRSTQETLVINWADQGAWYKEDHIASGSGLLAIQCARYIVRGFEPYTSIMEYDSAEASRGKTALWSIDGPTIETRFPALAIIDTRLDKLAAFAGLRRLIQEKEPFGTGKLHDCKSVVFGKNVLHEVSRLSEVMLWDQALKKMVLPRNMSRSNMVAAFGPRALGQFDRLAGIFSGQVDSADFSQDDAALLREAVNDLVLSTKENSITFRDGAKYKRQWQELLEDALITTVEEVRIVEDTPLGQKPESYIKARERAMDSPEVAEILGPDLMRVLTPAVQAHNSRAKLLRTRVKHN